MALALGATYACTPRPPPSAPASQATQDCGLRVEVTPPEGIAIWLDDRRLATQAPSEQHGLTPGPHTLLVRGMGYMPFTIPIVLTPGSLLRVPVALRPRPSEAERLAQSSPPARPASAPRAAPGPSAPPRRPPPPPTPPVSTDLPAGVTPLLLHLVAEPAGAIRVDGERILAREVRFTRSRGSLEVGSLRIAYSITPSRVLEFEVPDDAATWFKDATEVKPASTLRLTIGSTRLRRADAAGNEQSLIIRRVL